MPVDAHSRTSHLDLGHHIRRRHDGGDRLGFELTWNVALEGGGVIAADLIKIELAIAAGTAA